MTKKCGCGGQYRCAEARRLLREAMQRYEEWADDRTKEKWETYLKTKQRYEAHVGVEERP